MIIRVTEAFSIKTSKQSWAMWGLVSLFYMHEVILRVSPTIMTQELMQAFHVNAFELGFLASCFYYSYALLQIPCGIIVDKLGVRRLVILSALISSIGTFLFASSTELVMAEIGRFLSGAGAACGFISCLKVGMEWFSPLHFTIISGLSTMMGTLGGTFAGRPLAVVVRNLGWKTTMLSLGYIGIIVAMLCFFFLKDSKTQNNTSSLSLKIFLKRPKLWLIGLVGGFMYLPISVFAELWGVPFLMNAYDISKELASSTTTMIFIGLAAGGPGVALLEKYYLGSNQKGSHKKILQWASLLSAGLFFMVAFAGQLGLFFIFIILFLAGFCIGAESLCFAWAKENMPLHFGGTTVAFINSIVMIVGAIFQPLIGGVLDFFWDRKTSMGIPIYTIQTYQYAMMLIPICLILSSIILIFFKDRKRER